MFKTRERLLVVYCFLTLTLAAQPETNLYRQADNKALEQWVDSVYNSLSPDEKIGQLFCPSWRSKSSWKTKK